MRLADLLGVGVRETDPLHHALVVQVLERADRLGVRHLRVGPVVLVEPDRLHPEAAERAVDGLAEVARPAADGPLRAVALDAALGGYQDVGVAGPAERLGDELLVVAERTLVRGVAVGAVDERHTGVERGLDRLDGLPAVGQGAGGVVGPGQRHRAEADGADGAVADPPSLHALHPRSPPNRAFLAPNRAGRPVRSCGPTRAFLRAQPCVLARRAVRCCAPKCGFLRDEVSGLAYVGPGCEVFHNPPAECLGSSALGHLHSTEVRRTVAAPGPKISRYERPRAVRRSRSGVPSISTSSRRDRARPGRRRARGARPPRAAPRA